MSRKVGYSVWKCDFPGLADHVCHKEKNENSKPKMRYLVEHMENGVSPWVRLEYLHMTQIVNSSPDSGLIFTNYPLIPLPAEISRPAENSNGFHSGSEPSVALGDSSAMRVLEKELSGSGAPVVNGVSGVKAAGASPGKEGEESAHSYLRFTSESRKLFDASARRAWISDLRAIVSRSKTSSCCAMTERTST